MNIDLLVLDLGLYGGADALRAVLSENEAQPVTTVNLKHPEIMQDGDWDDLIDKLRRAQRCITL